MPCMANICNCIFCIFKQGIILTKYLYICFTSYATSIVAAAAPEKKEAFLKLGSSQPTPSPNKVRRGCVKAQKLSGAFYTDLSALQNCLMFDAFGNAFKNDDDDDDDGDLNLWPLSGEGLCWQRLL